MYYSALSDLVFKLTSPTHFINDKGASTPIRIMTLNWYQSYDLLTMKPLHIKFITAIYVDIKIEMENCGSTI